MLDQVDRRVDDFRQIVRRNVGRHADRDSARSVHQKIGHARRQNLGLLFGVVVVRLEIHRLFVDVFQQRGGELGKPRFGVSHRRRRIAVHRTEISLPVHQWIAHRERLRHAHQRIVDRRVAVRMVLTHHLPGDLRRFRRRAVRREAHLVHPVKDAPVYRLQPVADIRQRAPHDHAHRVIEVRLLHLVFNIDGNQISAPAVAASRNSRQIRLSVRWWRRGTLRWLFLVCQVLLLIELSLILPRI